MSYQDIRQKLDSTDVDTYHDEETAVEYMVYVSLSLLFSPHIL